MEMWSAIKVAIKENRLLIAILIVLTILLGLSYELKYRGRFYPGMTIGGESVGGGAYGDVLLSFKEKADAFTDVGLTLVFETSKGEREVKVPVFITGLTSDSLVSYFYFGNWKDAVRQAYDSGRTGPVWNRIASQLTYLLLGKRVDLPGLVNEPALQSLISRETKPFFKDSVPAQFIWNDGEIAITPEQPGEKVTQEEIVAAIQERLKSFDTAMIRLKTKAEKPAVTTEQLKPFSKLAGEVANGTNLVFYYRGNRWKVAGRTMATWLTLKKENEIGIASVKLKNFLAKTVVPLINDPPRNSRFEMRDRKLVEIIPGKRGNVVDIEKTIDKVEKIVYTVQGNYALTGNLLLALTEAGVSSQARTGTIEIPVETVQADPLVTQETIDNYGITDLVGYAVTSFKGSSPDRQHNIELGVSKLNGILLAPGEEFSAVKGLGAPTEEAGFRKEFVIKENKSVKENGGGLCQLATTLFRLALNAGLPITQRVPHRYVVSYYGPGLDATVYWPNPDVRFVNDTGNYLLLQGRVEATDVIFEFYGQHDGRTVQISDPVLTNELPPPPIKYVYTADLPVGQTECSETARKGVTTDVIYSVLYPNGEMKEQNFRSVYQPWQRICLVGTRQ